MLGRSSLGLCGLCCCWLQARLEVVARSRLNDLLLREARQVSSVDDRALSAYHRPMLQGVTELVDGGPR